MHSYRPVISSNPSTHFGFCCPCFEVPSTTHWWLFSPSCLPLIHYHNQGILVRSVLWIGRQNAGCHICSTPRFSRRRHFQVTADPLWPMIWNHTTSICHLQYGRVSREWPVIFFRVSLHPSHLGPSVSTDPFKGALNDDFFFQSGLLPFCKHGQSILALADQSC